MPGGFGRGRGALWGKDHVKRFSTNVEPNVGPGKYTPTEGRKPDYTTPRRLLSLIQWEPTSTASTSKQIKTSKQKLEWSRTIKHQSPDLDNTIATSVQSSLRLHLFHSNSLARQLKGLTRMMLPPWDQEFTNCHQTSRTANNLTKLLQSLFNSTSERDNSFLEFGANFIDHIPGPGAYTEELIVNYCLILEETETIW